MAYKKKTYHAANQFFVLLGRNIRVKTSDKMGIVIIISQATIIAILIVFAFRGFQSDYKKVDRLTRISYYSTEEYDKHVENGETTVIEDTLDEAKYWADRELGFISGQSGQRRGAILFIIAASTIWFGIVNSCREIVSERAILNREIKAYLHIVSYLTAKVTILAIISFMQTGVLLGIIHYFLIPMDNFLLTWFVLFLTAMAAANLGLLISATVKTEQASLMAVPILIIPQLLFGGLIRPVRYLCDQFFGYLHISDFILQKWSFNALLIFNSMDGKVLTQKINTECDHYLDYVRFTPERIIHVFFHQNVGEISSCFLGHNIPLLIITLHAFIPLLLAYIWLKKTYS